MLMNRADHLNCDREIAKRSLAEFLRMSWPVIDPSETYKHNWHMDAMGEHLEAVARGQITRLLINVPPGTSKSSAVSVFFPAWLWGPAGKPHYRFIGAAHEQSLATRDNRRTRLMVESDWYQDRWPVDITSDQNEKTYFENEQRGFRQSCPVSSMTGKRGHCLAGHVLVDTDQGRKPIKDIVASAVSCNVLSYDIYSKKLVYRPVEAVARREKKHLYRIHTTGGRVVDATGDHLFYTERGYIKARLLSTSDVLVSTVRSGVQKERVSAKESAKDGCSRAVLQPKLFNNLHQQQARQDGTVLHCLRGEGAQEGREAAMLPKMPVSGTETAQGKAKTEFAGYRVPDMRGAGGAENAQLCEEVLLNNVQKGGSFKDYVWGGQSRMEGRHRFDAVSEACDGRDKLYEADCDGEGSPYVRRLQISNRTEYAPHRHEYSEQRVGESGDTVCELPYERSRCRAASAEKDSVALVEKLHRDEIVYDIQVEDTRCFFANGVLVHNCVVWDDPINPEKANSETERETAERVFTETLPSRMVDPITSAIVIVMQRLHSEDVSGYILANDLGYEHLMLPMEFEPERKCYTSIGFEDPRTEEGELLFEDRFPRDVVERDKKAMGTYATAGQFQQRPVPRGGGLFKRHWFKIVAAAPIGTRWVRGWDLAATADAGAAWTAGVLVGEKPDGGFIIGGSTRIQGTAADVEKLLKATAAEDGTKTKGSIPQDPGQAGKAQVLYLIRQLAGYTYSFSPESGDKITRAEPLAAQAEAGNVEILRGDWNKDFLDELTLFPNSKIKDQVDAASRAFSELVMKPKYESGSVAFPI